MSDTPLAPVEAATRHLRVGLLALRHEEFEVAHRELAAAIATDPAAADAHAYLSATLLALGRPEEAQAAAARALELAPDGFGPRQKAGELALRLGDPAGAAGHFLAAVRAAEPGSADEAAARAALAVSRRQVRTAVDHRASLPRLPTSLRSLASIPARIRRTARLTGRS